MKPPAVLALLLGMMIPGAALAQPASGTRSVSDQFVIFRAPETPLPSAVAAAASTPEFLSLYPTILAVNCERIKQDLWRELDLTGPWSHRIYFHILPARSINDDVIIRAERFNDGWAYRVFLPTVVRQDRFARAVVQVLLTEIANRGAVDGKSAEIPHWFAEGFTRHLMSSYGTNFLLKPPDHLENGVLIHRVRADEVRTNVLNQTLQTLRSKPPLTFDQLSWPEERDFDGVPAEVYRSCAHLFVRQLLVMKNGRVRSREFLAELPRRHNWQFALFHAFNPEFQSALDVEKWWALQVVQFTGRDLIQTWTSDETGRKLDDVLRSVVEIRAVPSDLPVETEVALQSVVREWNFLEQSQLLSRKLRQLERLRMNAAPEYMGLIDDYRAAIDGYLTRRRTRGSILPANAGAGVRDRVADEFVGQLDTLDARRVMLRNQAQPPVAATQPAELQGR